VHQCFGLFCFHAWLTLLFFFSFIIRLDFWGHFGQAFFLAHEWSRCIGSAYVDEQGLCSDFLLGVGDSQLPLYIFDLLSQLADDCLFEFYLDFQL
jgi:hypothetical protein